MKAGVHAFDQDTEVEIIDRRDESGVELFTVRATLSRRWWIARGPNGGYVAAVMQRAMQAVAGDRPARSMTVQFAAAPDEGEVEVEVRVVRRGRTITFLSALMSQDGVAMLSALGIFGEDREPLLEYVGEAAVMPAEAGEPGEMRAVPPGTPGVPPVFENFMARVAMGPMPLSKGDVAHTGAWIRPVEPRLMDVALATAVLDVWIPAPFVMLDAPAPAPTLDLTYHYRGPLPLPEAGPEDPYLIEVRSSLARGGYFEEDARLWHSSGILVAHARQLALI